MEPADPGEQGTRSGGGRPLAALERTLFFAGLALFWERLWRAATPLVTVLGSFLVLSWFGVWAALPDLLRLGLVAGFVVAALAALAPLGRLGWPRRHEALSRLETVNGLVGRPLATLEDHLSNDADSGTVALWRAHRRRLAGSVGRLGPGLPSPRADRTDPYSLRALLLLVLVVAAIRADGAHGPLVADAFRLAAGAPHPEARIDAWLNPPAYTGRAPLLLGPGEAGAAPIAAPESSLVAIRAPADMALEVALATDGRPRPVAPEPTAPQPAAVTGKAGSALAEYRILLGTDARVTVTGDGDELRDWSFAIAADADPSILVLDQPSATLSGALVLKYRVEDDYGVVAAAARFRLPPDASGTTGARPLYEAPAFALRLPQARVRSARAETIRNLTSHPWAGARALMTLVARDEAGQEGVSDEIAMDLPARRFKDPLAKVLVEQRRRLALDANAAHRVAEALDALMIAPDRFMPDKGLYLALTVARSRLLAAETDDALRGIVDLLWQIALGIEDDGVSLEVDAARDAAERLMQALENGASDEEIARLTEELRQALAKLAEALAKRQPDTSAPIDPNARMVSPDDLDRMLKQMEDLARSGARDAARQMLSELQRMMENLETGDARGNDPVGEEMNRAMQELGDLVRRQNELLDRTFELDRQKQEAESGGPADRQAEAERRRQSGEIASEQEQLREALDQLAQRLRQLGAGETEALDRAGEEMGNAGSNLRRGRTGRAIENESDALDLLRQGAGSLAEAMRQRRQGMGSRPGRPFGREDPLGRPDRAQGPTFGDSVEVPDEIDAARARQILEEIRRRLGQPARPEPERDYLERLLRRN